MPLPFHRFRLPCASVAGVLLAAATPIPNLRAESAHSAPAGRFQFHIPASSDRTCSITLERPTAAAEDVGAVIRNEVTAAGLPAWQPSQFTYTPESGQTDTFFLRFTSGAKRGRYYTITANSSDSLTLFLNGDILVGNPDPLHDVATGDSFKILPYWTLDTAFPAGAGITPSSSAFSRATEILFADSSGSGINKAPGNPYFFFNGAWRNTGSGLADRGDDVILPDSHFTIRQRAAFPISPTIVGSVPMDPLGTALATRTNSPQDNPVALPRPSGAASAPDSTPYAGTSLNASGLFESGAITPGASPFRRGDEVLVYDNSQPGMNHAPSKIYYHLGGAWRRVGAPASLDAGGERVFTPGGGVIIRKIATGSNPSPASVWTNARDYLTNP